MPESFNTLKKMNRCIRITRVPTSMKFFKAKEVQKKWHKEDKRDRNMLKGLSH